MNKNCFYKSERKIGLGVSLNRTAVELTIIMRHYSLTVLILYSSTIVVFVTGFGDIGLTSTSAF
jgi:hypothetical protein